jgi:hypothetical protein
MSEYAVHFTKDGEDGASAYDNMMAILYGGVLRAGVRAYGAVTWLANRWPEIAESHRCVCLSEIPLDQLDRLVEKRSQYGIGFRKTFLAEEGGVRVWYIDKEEAGGRAVRAYVSSEAERAEKAWDATDPIFNAVHRPHRRVCVWELPLRLGAGVAGANGAAVWGRGCAIPVHPG